MAGVAVAGCRKRNDGTELGSDLVPPKNAPAWESRYAIAFDDSYTPTTVNLQGRAPNDVLDQQLFQARLGHAALVLLVRVEQVWGKGRYEGRQDQFVELEVGEVLMGEMPKGAPERLMVKVDSIDELPGRLRGEIMLFFVRWDEDSGPPYHHHLMPADDELVALIKAMVKHAQDEGVLDAKGSEKKRGRKGRGQKKNKKKNKKNKRKPDFEDDTVEELDAGPTPVGTAIPSGSEAPRPPDEPPPADAPEPDASTGLQDLGGGGDDPAADPAPGGDEADAADAAE